MTDNDLSMRKVLAIATNYGFEQDELTVPVEHLRGWGAGEPRHQPLADQLAPRKRSGAGGLRIRYVTAVLTWGLPPEVGSLPTAGRSEYCTNEGCPTHRFVRDNGRHLGSEVTSLLAPLVRGLQVMQIQSTTGHERSVGQRGQRLPGAALPRMESDTHQ